MAPQRGPRGRKVDPDASSIASSDLEAEREENEGFCDGDACRFIRTLTLSSRFSLFVAVIIVLNVVVMAIQADYPVWKRPEGCTNNCVNVWTLVNVSFLIFFSFELTMRFITFGCAFFTDEADWSWNIFDFSVVMLGWFDLLSKIFLAGGGGGNMVMIIRIIRILRILRVLRLFRQLKKLTMLVRGLIESMNVVFWITLLIVSMILVMAIFCTTLIGQNKNDWGDEAEDIEMHWGSVLKSSLTLFSYLTLDDWSNMTRQVMRVQPVMLWIFLFYVVVAAFVVLSLLTGVMAEHMNAVRMEEERDEDWERQLEMGSDMAVFLSSFKKYDRDEDNHINLAEFKGCLELPEMQEEMDKLEIRLKGIDLDELFSCLDSDLDGLLSWTEFQAGLEEIRKGDHPRQAFKVQAALSRVSSNRAFHIAKNTGRGRPPAPGPMSAAVERKLDEVTANLTGFEDHFDMLHDEMKEFVETLRRRQGQHALRRK